MPTLAIAATDIGDEGVMKDMDDETSVDADVYHIIRDAGSADTVAIAAALPSRSDESIAEAIVNLQRLGVVVPSLVQPGHYRAPARDAAIQRGLAHLIERALRDAALLSDIAGRGGSITSATESEPRITSLTGHDEIVGYISGAIARAQTRIDSLLASIPSREVLASALVEDCEAESDGTQSRFIYPEEARSEPYVIEYIEAMRSHDCMTRTHHFTPMRLLITDNNEAVIANTQHGAAMKGVAVREPLLVDFMRLVFEDLWSQARPVIPEHDNDGAISDRDKQVLRMIAQGATFSAIATAINRKERTVRHIVADLRAVTGAHSTEQLVAIAGRHGWLE
ncbi:MAG: helix-turn-helix domain-containing protein [Cellulomonadaceae bacterium]|jgi:DNA-binding CsgD family transcriptional regulator|nr:helix-turn-helix domain-containing protein [Cellulomonadaceae bacterium]